MAVSSLACTRTLPLTSSANARAFPCRAFITLFIIFYSVLYESGHLLKLPPQGVIQFELRSNRPRTDVDTDVDLRDLKYCSQNQSPSTINFTKFPCVFFDGLMSGIISGENVLVATRVSATKQRRRRCQYKCDNVWEPPLVTDDTVTQANTRFVAAPAFYRLKIDHAIAQSTLGIGVEARHMDGKLYVGFETGHPPTPEMHALCKKDPTASKSMFAKRGNQTVKSTKDKEAKAVTAPCYISPRMEYDGADSLPLSDIFDAANITLDGASYNDRHSQRFNGLNVVASVEYKNYRPFTGVTPRIIYVYHFTALTASSYERTLTHYQYGYEGMGFQQLQQIAEGKVDDGFGSAFEGRNESRIAIQYSGINFHFVQDGMLGKFDFQTLLMTITTGLTLLALAATITNGIAMYLMKDKRFHRAVAWEYSEDFSDLHQGGLHDLSLDELRDACDEMGLPMAGRKEELIYRLFREQQAREREQLTRSQRDLLRKEREKMLEENRSPRPTAGNKADLEEGGLKQPLLSDEQSDEFSEQ